MSHNPTMVSDTVWFYDDADGMAVFIDDDRGVRWATVPWSEVRAALARKDKKRKPRVTTPKRSESVKRKRRAA